MTNFDLHLNLLALQYEGLVIGKRHPTRPWTLFKYHNKVFYNNLWHKSEALLEARGIVIDDDGKIVQRPFHKCFNVGENGTKFPHDGEYESYRKINGFMAAASWYDAHNLLVTTTGSFVSDYQKMALEWLHKPMSYGSIMSYTYIFEICDARDPHIVGEEYGAYLLAVREKATGEYLSQDACDNIAKRMRAKRPEKAPWDSTAQHEGFMFYDHKGRPISKCKTPYYLSKKALMRLGKAAVNCMFEDPKGFKQRLDEEYYKLFDTTLARFSKEEYAALSEQGRREWIEEYFSK